MMRSIALFCLAGILEISGGYLVWIWLRESRALGMGVLGFVLLSLYGVLPTLQEKSQPFGRVYAVYGGVFIVLSLFWGWWIEGQRPDLRDWLGVCVTLAGAWIIWAPRATS